MMRKWWWWTQWCWYHSNNGDGDNLTEEFLRKMQRTFGYHPYLSHRKPANFETWGEKHPLCIKEVWRILSKKLFKINIISHSHKNTNFIKCSGPTLIRCCHFEPAVWKCRCGNTKDENIFTTTAPPLIYGDYYTKLRGRTLTKCNIYFYSPFTINATPTTICSGKIVQ